MRGTLAFALFVAGIAIAAPTNALAVGGLNTLTVSPGHGRVATQFQVTYAISPCTQAAGLTIGFSWNGLTPAGQVLGTAATDSACRATLTTRPPAAAAPGTYQVFGYVALPTGAAAPNTEASTTYSVDVTPTATANSSPTASASVGSTASASAASDTSAPSASTPAGSDQPGAADTAPSAGKGMTLRFSPVPDWWTLNWPVVLGVSILALAVLAALAISLLFMGGRRRRGRAAPGPSKDKAA